MSKRMENNLHPRCRLIFLIGSLASILLIVNILQLIIFYTLFILPLIIVLNNFRTHLRLLFFGIIPIFLSFILLYIVVLNGRNGGWLFINLKCLKILCLTSLFQIALTIPPNLLITTFKKWGFKGDSLLTLIGSFTVWAEVKTKSNQIITARFARGFIGNRSFINKAKQLPHVLIPLIIGIIRTATERVEVWKQREIPYLISNVKPLKINYSVWLNTLVIVIPFGVFVILFCLRYL